MISLLLLLSGSAFAQDDPDPDTRARELYENGAILYEEGRYEEAIVAWQQAYDLSERHALLYNIANAQERAGQYQAALDTLAQYRALAPASERDVLDRRLKSIERRMEEAGQVATTTTTTPAESGSGVGIQALPLGLIGVGAAALGTGTVFAVRSRSAGAQLEEMCVSGLCPSEADPLLQTNTRSALIADVAWGVGAVAAAGGVVVWVLDDRVRVQPAPGGLLVGGNF